MIVSKNRNEITDIKTRVREGSRNAAESASNKLYFHGAAGQEANSIKDLSSAKVVTSADVLVDMQVGYVYLGVAERNKFAEAAFEILIDQVQKASEERLVDGKKKTITNIGFNHCVQELVWAVTYQATDGMRQREPLDFSGPRDAAGHAQRSVISAQLKLNNSKRLTHLDGEAVPGEYFSQLDPYLHHTRVPDHVYAYSFAITPESNQPSGSCNFSRIDRSSFEITCRSNTDARIENPTLHMFARNWNVFRISLGLGGLVWAS